MRAPPPEPDDRPFSRTITVGRAMASRWLVGETFPGYEGAKLVITAIDREAGTMTIGAVEGPQTVTRPISEVREQLGHEPELRVRVGDLEVIGVNRRAGHVTFGPAKK